MPGLNWSHALIQVHDFDAMVDFYTDCLGFEVTNSGAIGESKVAFMSQNSADHHQIALVAGKPEEQQAPAVNHFAFRVDSLGDVKDWYTKLNSDDRAQRIMPLCHGNAWSVYFADPEGNGLEIFCDTPWHVAQPQGGPWDPTADDETIHAETLAKFKDEPEFQPMEEFISARRAHLASRQR